MKVNPEYSLEGLMLKLKLQYFGHLIRRADSLEKTLMLGKIEGGRKRGWQRMKWLGSITDLMDISLSKFQEMVKNRGAQSAAIHGVAKSQTWWTNWTAKICFESEKKWHLESAQFEARLTALLTSDKITGSRTTNCIITYLPSSLKGESR